jgi:hypothetical protein
MLTSPYFVYAYEKSTSEISEPNIYLVWTVKNVKSVILLVKLEVISKYMIVHDFKPPEPPGILFRSIAQFVGAFSRICCISCSGCLIVRHK